MRVGAHTPTHARTPTTFTQTATRTPKTPATAPLITKCAKELIVINGRLHIFDKLVQKRTKRALRCQHKDFCPGRLWVNLDNSHHSTIRDHTCERSLAELSRAKMFAHVRQRATTSSDIPVRILHETTELVNSFY
jgi:hypothetical protein